MALSTLHNVRFAGMASCVPHRILDNLRDCPPSQRSERERLVRNIGIQTRRITQPWQCFSDLAFDATEALLEKLQWRREEIDRGLHRDDKEPVDREERRERQQDPEQLAGEIPSLLGKLGDLRHGRAPSVGG